MRVVGGVVVSTYRSWRADRTIRLGAGLAYYGLFSIASVLTLSLSLISLFGRRAATTEYLTEQFESMLGDIGVDLAGEVTEILEGNVGTQLGLVGLVSLLVTGSLFFLALEDALNQIWGVPVPVGIWTTIRRRATSLLVLLGAAAALVISLAAQAITSIAEALLPGSSEGLDLLSAALANGVTWAVLAIAVVLLFRYLPSAEVGWRPAIVGGTSTAALLIVGTAVVGWYLRNYGASSLTGAASSVLAVLVWIFYEAQIVLAGAQLTKTLSNGALSDEAGSNGAGPNRAGSSPAPSSASSDVTRARQLTGRRGGVRRHDVSFDDGRPAPDDERNTMALGPIEVVVLGFPGNEFNGQILPELERLVEQDTISIVDGLFLRKDADGSIEFIEFDELGANADAERLAGLIDQLDALISDEDVEELAAGLDANSSAAILVFEHTWVKPFRDAVVDSGGVMVANFRVPGLAVQDLLDELAAQPD